MELVKVVIEKLKSIVVFKVLLALDDMENKNIKANISQFLNYIKMRPETFYKYKDLLIELNLIRETRSEAFPFNIYITLTEKGKRIVEKIKEIEKILSE